MKLYEEIWNKVSKDNGNGKRTIRYESVDDLVFLYASGFVDAEKYSMEDWIQSFASCEQKDKSYSVSYDDWFGSEKFFYSGPIREPFNPLKIKKSELTEEEAVDLFKRCVIPSSQSTEEKIPLFMADYQERGLLKDGKLAVTDELKKELNEFIINFPSPLRVLEVNIVKLRNKEEGAALSSEEMKPAGESKFSVGKTAAQTTQSQLDVLLSGQKKK